MNKQITDICVRILIFIHYFDFMKDISSGFKSLSTPEVYIKTERTFFDAMLVRFFHITWISYFISTAFGNMFSQETEVFLSCCYYFVPAKPAPTAKRALCFCAPHATLLITFEFSLNYCRCAYRPITGHLCTLTYRVSTSL